MKIQKLNNEQCLTILDEEFHYNTYDNKIEISTYTDRNVNMLIELDLNNIYDSLEEWIDTFDIEEEIELHRESDKFRKAFTLKQSLEDFEDFKQEMQELLERMQIKDNKKDNETRKKELKEYLLQEFKDYIDSCLDEIVDLNTGELQEDYYCLDSFQLNKCKVMEILTK